MRLLKLLASLHDRLTFVASVLASVGLMSIVASYVYEVVTRYFFNAPTAWASDYVAYALAASIFLALPQVTKDRGHVAVTILVDLLPTRAARMVHTFVNLVGFSCLSLAAWISFQENMRQFTKGIETLAIVPIPQWWVSSFITFGLLLSALHMLRHAPPSKFVEASGAQGSVG
ncbi:MAG: TRAP transporter small permease subunit [Boseongicola sp.]|nr:MAG: TRAP transporter small permease subunit [Boseongicola sp.]